MALLLWVAVMACSGPEPGGDAPPAPAPTGDTAPPGPFEASCMPMADNALRVWCSATLLSPGPVRVELERPEVGAPLRELSSPEARVTHEVLGWGLRAETVYTWRVIDERGGQIVEGTVTTGALPTEFDVFRTRVEQPRPDAEVEGVLLAPGCPGGSVVIVDREGFVVWYQWIEDVAPVAGFLHAMTFTADNTIVVGIGKQTLLEFDLAGRLLMRADRGEQFTNFIHHDLFARDGFVYTLQSDVAPIDGTSYVIDGVYVFDRTGAEVDALTVRDFYPLSVEPYMLGGYWSGQFPGAVDFSHVNAVSVDEAGDVWLSFRHLHAFAKLRGGPGTPAFGELLWTAVGEPSSPIAALSDFTLVGDDAVFAGQHDVHSGPDNTVLMLDNGFFGDATARAVRFELDEAARTLSTLDAWDLDAHCPIHGSAQELPDGGVLATCTAAGRIREFRPSVPGYAWQLEATCQEIVPVQLSRGIPIDL